MRFTLLLALLGLTLFASSCSATKSSTDSDPGAMRDERGWLLPSKQLAQRIEIRANEAEFLKGEEQFVELTDWFYRIGEPAYPTLLDLAASKSTMSAQVGMASIAVIADRRLLEPFKARVPMPSKEAWDLRLSWGRAMLAMNELAGVPALIEGLEHESLRVRQTTARALNTYVKNSGIRYDPAGTPEERAEGIAAWRAWYERMMVERTLDAPQR